MVLNDGLARGLLGLRLSIFSRKRLSEIVEISVSRTRSPDGWGYRVVRSN